MQKNLLIKKTIDPPPEIQQLAKQNELGELRKVYTIVRSNTTIFGIGMLCAFFGGFGIVFGVAILFLPPPQSSPLGFTVSAFILFIAGLDMILARRHYTHWHVYLWQYGFIYEKKQTRQAFRWNQIVSAEAYPPLNIVVRRQDGYKVTLRNVFSDISELMDVVVEESTRQLAPPDFRITPPPGNTRTFAQHKIDHQGIGNAQERLSWEEIQEFTTKDGIITLLKKSE